MSDARRDRLIKSALHGFTFAERRHVSYGFVAAIYDADPPPQGMGIRKASKRLFCRAREKAQTP